LLQLGHKNRRAFAQARRLPRPVVIADHDVRDQLKADHLIEPHYKLLVGAGAGELRSQYDTGIVTIGKRVEL
jgi:hypothetical protein